MAMIVVIGIGTYALLSTFFYYYPHLLHKKPKKFATEKTEFLIISHRGGAAENTENTISAFQHSMSIGVDVIELDVHITKDRKVVVSHDNSLARLAGVDKLIGDLNYHELPPLEENIYVLPYSKDKLEASKKNDEKSAPKKIPLLEEVLEEFPTIAINLDIKINNDELINQVSTLLKKYNREHMTTWGSFNESVTKKCHKLNPNVPLMFSLGGVIRLFFLISSGLLPFVPIKESYFEILMPNSMIKNKDLPIIVRTGLWFFKLIFIRKSLVRHLQKRGLLVYYWVLNTEEEFEAAFNIGANGIITDYPSRLVDYLSNHEK